MPNKVVMRVEQRWNAAGETRWCVIFEGRPYPFGSQPSDEAFCHEIIRVHPEGVAQFRAFPEYEFRQPKGPPCPSH